MAILTVIKAGHPVLKQIAKPVDRVDKNIKKLLDDMAETMHKSNGVGLAAPQVNQSIRVIVCDDGNGLLELINPEIIKKDGCEIGLEGCLSIPGYYGDVERAKNITVRALNRKNKQIQFKASGFLARVIQHEVDHLDGILFIEKADTLEINKDKLE